MGVAEFSWEHPFTLPVGGCALLAQSRLSPSLRVCTTQALWVRPTALLPAPLGQNSKEFPASYTLPLWSTVAVRWGLQLYKPIPGTAKDNAPCWECPLRCSGESSLVQGPFHWTLRPDSDMGLASQPQGAPRELWTRTHWSLLSRREEWANTHLTVLSPQIPSSKTSLLLLDPFVSYFWTQMDP